VLLLVVVPVAVGVLLGYVRGGRLRRLADVPVRATSLLWIAAALQVLHFDFAGTRETVESTLHLSLMVPIFGLVGVWALVNLPGRSRLARAAVALVLVGGAMNALAIAANGRMPYSEPALAAAHVSDAQRARGESSPKHEAADGSTRLPWLGDVLPVRPIQKVVSAGDIVLLLGVAAAVTGGMAPSAPGRPSIRTRLPSEPGAPRRPGRAGQAEAAFWSEPRRARFASRSTGHTGVRRSGPIHDS
jgi:hypothetical protein